MTLYFMYAQVMLKRYKQATGRQPYFVIMMLDALPEAWHFFEVHPNKASDTHT